MRTLVTLSAIPRVRLQDSAYKSAMLQIPPFNNFPICMLYVVTSEVHDISASILTHACFLSFHLLSFSNSLQVSGRGVLIDLSEDWWRRGVCPLSHSVTPNQPCLIAKPKKVALCLALPCLCTSNTSCSDHCQVCVMYTCTINMGTCTQSCNATT
jgi:hypothetical protein